MNEFETENDFTLALSLSQHTHAHAHAHTHIHTNEMVIGNGNGEKEGGTKRLCSSSAQLPQHSNSSTFLPSFLPSQQQYSHFCSFSPLSFFHPLFVDLCLHPPSFPSLSLRFPSFPFFPITPSMVHDSPSTL